jgi:hypothetical protein
VIIYSGLLFIAWRVLTGKFLINVYGKFVLIALGVILIVSAMQEALFDHDVKFLGTGIAAGLDTLLLPIATIALVSAIAFPMSDTKLQIRKVSNAVLAIAFINVAVSIAQLYLDLDFESFWSGSTSGEVTVATLAEMNGRYSGLINQPAEAGILYGVAAAVAFSTRISRFWIRPFCLSILLLGSFLSATKVFYAVFLMLALLYVAKECSNERRIRRIVSVIVSLLLAALMALPFGILADRTNRINVLAEPASVQVQTSSQRDSQSQTREGFNFLDAIAIASAGRIAPGGTLATLSKPIFETSPLWGLGLSGWKVSYDSSWLEVFVYAGLVGVTSLLGIFMVLWVRAVRIRREDNFLLLNLTLVATVASLGIGVWTANRVSTVLWILVTLAAFSKSLAEGTKHHQDLNRGASLSDQ